MWFKFRGAKMSKFTVKTKLSNIKKEDGQFTYKEEIVSMKWDEKERKLTNEEEMLRLDAQGRHRSEWCYAAYDGRKEKMFSGYNGFVYALDTEAYDKRKET